MNLCIVTFFVDLLLQTKGTKYKVKIFYKKKGILINGYVLVEVTFSSLLKKKIENGAGYYSSVNSYIKQMNK